VGVLNIHDNKVTPQVAALGAESAVYDCLVSGCERRFVYVKEIRV